jgi:hypothetical protein
MVDKYKPAFCVDLYKEMAAGKSDTQVMAKWGISRSTFYRWEKEHPEFKEAKEKGKVAFDAIHESLGIQGMLKTSDIDYQFWRDLGKFRHGWTEKTPTSGNTINIDTMNVLNNQTNDELLLFIKNKLEELPELRTLNVLEDLGQDETIIDC